MKWDEYKVAYFIKVNEPFEGRVRTLYADVKGLITVGVGNLVDPIDAALCLPFVDAAGTPLTRAEITTWWHHVKNDPMCAVQGYRYAERYAVNGAHLPDEAIDALIATRIQQMWDVLDKYIPKLDTYPSRVHMVLMSMAWAMGPHFLRAFPTFKKRLLARDWLSAADQCKISEAGNPGVKPRNAYNKTMLLAAYGAGDT